MSAALKDKKIETPEVSPNRIHGYLAESIDMHLIKVTYEHFHQGRRKAPRYALGLEVILYTSHKSFPSRSINVSATGILLRESLPVEFMKEPFDIVVIHSRGSERRHMIFRGKSVGASEKSPRIEFSESALSSQKTLMGLFENLTPLSEMPVPKK